MTYDQNQNQKKGRTKLAQIQTCEFLIKNFLSFQKINIIRIR